MEWSSSTVDRVLLALADEEIRIGVLLFVCNQTDRAAAAITIATEAAIEVRIAPLPCETGQLPFNPDHALP